MFFWLGFSSLRVFVCLVLVSDFPTWLPMTKAVGHTAAAFVIFADFPIWAATTYQVTGTFNCRALPIPCRATPSASEKKPPANLPEMFYINTEPQWIFVWEDWGLLDGKFQVISIDIMIIYFLDILVWAVPCWDVWCEANLPLRSFATPFGVARWTTAFTCLTKVPCFLVNWHWVEPVYTQPCKYAYTYRANVCICI